jgi:CheY-like chemotaxis protein
MLSDMDGWEILTLLHSTARTRSIPVIVCSVIRQEELALGLGASLYIPKPVGRQDFIQALDRVLPLATTATQTAPKNNAAAS